MDKIYITLTGTQHYHGKYFLETGMKVTLEKEPDNKYDKEAIAVKYKGFKIGYVANSVHTVSDGTVSAGRIYDKIGKKAKAKVWFISGQGVICKVGKKWLK